MSVLMIGNTRYSPARAAQVREAGNVDATHSAVAGDVAVYVDSMTEANALIEAWPEVMAAVNDKVVEILARGEGNG